MQYTFCSKIGLMLSNTRAAGAGGDVQKTAETRTGEHHLVEVAEAHPLYRRRLPFRQRGDELHSGRLLLQHSQR